jgi:AraC-like DNA-binding protein
MRSEHGLQSVPDTPATPVVLACALTAQQRARLVDALRGRVELRFVDTFADLLRGLKRTIEDIDVVVLPARDDSGTDATRAIREVAAQRPGVAIVVHCPPGSQYSSDLRALAAAGAHQFVFAGIDDVGVTFRAVLSDARRQCSADWVMQQLAPLVPPLLPPIVAAALTHPEEIKVIRDVANALGVHRKTLFNRCERVGFLTPNELIVWARLALVGHALGTTGCTVETIAQELGFTSDTSLRNTIKRYMRMRATDVRANGGLQCVLDALRRRITP